MRSIINFVVLLAGATFLFVGCEKVAELPSYKLGHPVTLTPSATSVSPGAADSAKTVLTLNWTFPQYATDSANMKYIVEIDSTGRNFSKEITSTQTKKLNKTFTGRDLNTLLLNYGYSVGKPVKLDMRVTSSYANNNEKYISNVVQVTVTPYSDPSKLTTENTAVTGTSGTSSDHSNTFSWSSAFPGYTGTVTYVVEYDSAGKNFVSPQTIAGYGGASVYSASLNQGDMNTTALTSGIAVGTTGTVEYRVKATTASGSAAYAIQYREPSSESLARWSLRQAARQSRSTSSWRTSRSARRSRRFWRRASDRESGWRVRDAATTLHTTATRSSR